MTTSDPHRTHPLVTSEPPTTDVFITNLKSGMVLSVQDASTERGTRLVIWQKKDASKSLDQRWRFERTESSGQYNVLNRGSGLYVAVQDGSTQPGVPLVIWPLDSKPDKVWKTNDLGDGIFTIANATTKLVWATQDASPHAGTLVVQYTYNGGADQKWQFVLVPAT